jgi:hypothetical protein
VPGRLGFRVDRNHPSWARLAFGSYVTALLTRSLLIGWISVSYVFIITGRDWQSFLTIPRCSQARSERTSTPSIIWSFGLLGLYGVSGSGIGRDIL